MPARKIICRAATTLPSAFWSCDALVARGARQSAEDATRRRGYKRASACYFRSRCLATDAMKLAGFVFLCGLCLISSARADLTIVQKVEGIGGGGEMTMKIKGDKMRIEVSPQITTIFDGKTGELTNLMNDQKTVVRISADKMKAAAEMIRKFNSKKDSAEKAKLVSTGKKETINGYETEQYAYDEPDFKATYWIALNYPDGAAILKQLQAIKSEAWNATNTKVPDYRDFPGLPIRTHITMTKPHEGTASNSTVPGSGTEITTTLTSIKQDPLSDAEFAVPKDYQEMSMSDIFGGKKAAAPSVSPNP
jgi:hypothetical protein